ncbi:hypothetical protein HYDPIDRAFT_27475 [Hydnomerulius pinastri MD-312]|nr:hypothetical protein HYDPIDRAFT_27475 [Hydnomerulius pinastri MD-312]
MSVPADFLRRLFIRKSLAFVGESLLIYDYVLTLGQEVEYVWNAPWSIVKATFLLNRYGNLIGQSFVALEETGILSQGSEKFCARFNLFTAIFMIFSSESIHILVLMRAWAIWGCQYRIAVWLTALYIIYMMVVVGMTAYGANSANFIKFQYLDIVGVCVGIIPPLVWLTYLASFILDTGMFAMVVHSLRKFSKESRPLYPSSLLHLLARDAFAFYIMGLFNSAFTIVSWTAYSTDARYFLPLAFSFPVLSLIGQRLVLNLRGLQTRHYTTRDLSREVNRQMAAMGNTSFWQAVEQWPNAVPDGPLDPEWSGSSDASGMTRGTDIELKELQQHGEEPEGIHEVCPQLCLHLFANGEMNDLAGMLILCIHSSRRDLLACMRRAFHFSCKKFKDTESIGN